MHMNRNLGLGMAAAAGLLGLGLLSKRQRIRDAIGDRMRGRMERMMARLPDNSPPKLVMSVLPQLREQNDEIIRLLHEQNALLSASQGRTNAQEQGPAAP